MLENAKKVLNIISSNGYDAYIVGGFVRNYLLGMESNDIDITTNATPKELQEIFKDSCVPSTDYGAVVINSQDGIRYEITTFRKEISYVNNRKPVEIKYIDSLKEDLIRRDFTVNTICIDKDGKIIDYLNGREDLNNKVIKSVLSPYDKFEEDSLRILRAIRFAATLDFRLDSDVEKAIIEKKYLLKNLSYQRKKEELDKIFSSTNAKKGIELILKLGLDEELELKNLSKVENIDSLIGVWAILNVTDIYPFTNSEKDLIKDINEALLCNNYDPYILYKHGLYVNQTAGVIKNLDKKKITKIYNELIITSRKDLDITSEEIIEMIGREPGEYLKKIYEDIEKKVLYKKINNTNKDLTNYIKENIEKY